MGYDEQRILAAVLGKVPNKRGWVGGTCPLCEERTGKADRKRSLGVNVATSTYHCFKCGAQGRIYDIESAFAYAADYAEDAQKQAPEPITPPEHFYPLEWERNTSCLQPAWEYLRTRHITYEEVCDLHIGACPVGKCAGRVVVPVFDAGGRWEWWVARAWVPKAEKPYMYPSGARGGLLFNERVIDIATDEPALVVEGVFDAIPHLPDVVACLGKPNDAHMERLARSRRPVVFALDGDAWEEALGACLRLRMDGVPTGAIRLPPRTDPHVTDRGALRSAARRALLEWSSVGLE